MDWTRSTLQFIVLFTVIAFLFAWPLSNIKAVDAQEAQNTPSETVLRMPNGDSLQLIHIEPGTFQMGRDTTATRILSKVIGGEGSAIDEGPARQVKITKAFFVGKFKVTTTQFCQFLNSLPAASHETLITLNKYSLIRVEEGKYFPKSGAERCAVNTVSWEGVQEFCRWLSAYTKRSVRLPTEAEWEFVARGSEGRRYPWGNHELEKSQWLPDSGDKSSFRFAHPVDASPANSTPQGVVGMAGVVGEWVSDYYGVRYLEDDTIDPQGPSLQQLPIESLDPLIATYKGTDRVLRRAFPVATAREPGKLVVDDAGIYGFRVVVDVSH